MRCQVRSDKVVTITHGWELWESFFVLFGDATSSMVMLLRLGLARYIMKFIATLCLCRERRLCISRPPDIPNGKIINILRMGTDTYHIRGNRFSFYSLYSPSIPSDHMSIILSSAFTICTEPYEAWLLGHLVCDSGSENVAEP